jgi:hypothetical protein
MLANMILDIWWVKVVIFTASTTFSLVFLCLWIKARHARLRELKEASRRKTQLYAFKCGHQSVLEKDVLVFGEMRTTNLSEDDLDYCPDCLAAMAIRCAWCGGIILPGDPITLYVPSKPEFMIPEHAVKYGEPPSGYSHPRLVGCLGWDCAESGMDRSGFWIPPGKVQRVASGTEILLGRAEAGIDEPLIINNLSDPRNAIPLPDDI